MYPINFIADLNAMLGFFYVHMHYDDVSLAPDPSNHHQGTHGDTSYYFFETQDLPLFGPLRTLGVPKSLIDVVEPFFRAIVELGYDRSIPRWAPARRGRSRCSTRRQWPTISSTQLERVSTNARAVIGSPPRLSIPAPPAFGGQCLHAQPGGACWAAGDASARRARSDRGIQAAAP